MSCESAPISWGESLRETDYADLERSWITRPYADRAQLRRVTSFDGASIVGRRNNGSYAGIIFPYIWPGEDHVRDYRLRRDQPDLELDAAGNHKQKNKYLSPPERGNKLYFVPGTPAGLLTNPRVPVAITEGEKKTIALYRLAWYQITADLPHFLPVGLCGVWSFRGTIGKVPGPDGSRRDEKGVIPDLERLVWTDRVVFVIYDANVRTNPKVAAARRALTRELKQRGARVFWVNLPAADEISRDQRS